jgi:tape measure domain-containing protein
MATERRIQVTVDGTGAQKGRDVVIRSLRDITREAQRLNKALGGTDNKLDQLAATPAATGLRKVTSESSKLRSEMNDLKRSTNGVGQSLRTLKAVLLTLGLGRVLKAVIGARQQFDATNAALLAVTGSTSKAQKEFEFIRQTARRLGFEIGSVSGQYVQLLASTKAVGLSTEVTRNLFTKLAEAGRVLGLSTQRINFAILAVQQIASKGTLSLEELRRQLGEQIPGVVPRLGAALGFGEGRLKEFFKAIEQGQITATEALPALAQVLEESFGAGLEQALNTVQASIGRLRAALFDASLAVAEGFAPAFKDGVDSLKEFIDTNQQALKQIGQLLGTVTKLALEGFQFLVENIELVKAALGTLIAVKVGAFFLTATTAAQGFFTAIAAGTLSFSALIAVAGGVVLAINGLISKFKSIQDEEIAAATALDDFGVAMRELTNDAANGVVQLSNLTRAEEELAKVTAAQTRAQEIRTELLPLQQKGLKNLTTEEMALVTSLKAEAEEQKNIIRPVQDRVELMRRLIEAVKETKEVEDDLQEEIKGTAAELSKSEVKLIAEIKQLKELQKASKLGGDATKILSIALKRGLIDSIDQLSPKIAMLIRQLIELKDEAEQEEIFVSFVKARGAIEDEVIQLEALAEAAAISDDALRDLRQEQGRNAEIAELLAGATELTGQALDDEIDRLQEGLETRDAFINKIKEEVDARSDAEKAADKAAAKAKREAEKLAEEARKPFDTFIEDTQRAFSEFFVDIFDNGLDSFENFADSLGKLFKKLLADLIAQAIQKNIVGAIFGGEGGAQAGAGGFFSQLRGLFGGGGPGPSTGFPGFDPTQPSGQAFGGLPGITGPVGGGQQGGGGFFGGLGQTFQKGGIGGGLAGAGIGAGISGVLGGILGGTLGSPEAQLRRLWTLSQAVGKQLSVRFAATRTRPRRWLRRSAAASLTPSTTSSKGWAEAWKRLAASRSRSARIRSLSLSMGSRSSSAMMPKLQPSLPS